MTKNRQKVTNSHESISIDYCYDNNTFSDNDCNNNNENSNKAEVNFNDQNASKISYSINRNVLKLDELSAISGYDRKKESSECFVVFY